MGKRITLCVLGLALAGCTSTPRGPTPNERKAEAFLEEGVDALGRRQYTEALRALLQAKGFNGKSPEIWNNLGVTYASMNEIAKAEESWRNALQVSPGFNDARLNLGMLYFGKKRYTESERILKEASKDLAYKGADKVAYQLAQIYLVQNKPLLAEQQLQVAVRDNAGNCPAWLQLGWLQKERGDYAEAEQSLRGATKGICYKNPSAHYELATLLLKTHDVTQAKAKLLEIIQLFPTSEWAQKSEATLNMIR